MSGELCLDIEESPALGGDVENVFFFEQWSRRVNSRPDNWLLIERRVVGRLSSSVYEKSRKTKWVSID